ncbi:MAG: bicyclomycin resistance protein [Ideonella sp.]|nr:bicyclomycin resistance protein [Ideonella sp.]
MAGLLASFGAGPLFAAPALSPAGAGSAKVFRYAFRVAETGFDPARITDLYSRTVTAQIFESLYFYDHLARPADIRPLTAVGMPEADAEFKTFTIRIQPGIYFADDPAFKGARRELVAQDYVYAIKRMADPAIKSQRWSSVQEWGLVGLAEQRSETVAKRVAFDFDRELPGLRALDRYTLQLRTVAPRPRMVEELADSGSLGAVAREVVEFYGEQIAAHPVGTGAFRLKSWRRSSEIVLERNPGYRERHYEDEAHPAPGDAAGQALLARFKGRRLPMVDEVVVSIIEENQPRWLSFLNGQHDFMERLPEEFTSVALPGGKVAPNLARRGVQAVSTVGPESWFTVYNMEDPVIGGYTPEKVALRRAIGLALDLPGEIAVVRRGQAIPAQSMASPHTTGYDPNFKSDTTVYDPARAKALLDMYGYIDRDGDGWRELPDGQPLKLVRRTHADALQRELDAHWQKSMKAVGIRVEFEVAQWPQNLKAAYAGKFQVWVLGSSASQLDGQSALQYFYGPAVGSGNLARFRNDRFDAIFERMSMLPNGPERDALFLEAKRIALAYAPYRHHVHRFYNDLTQPWLLGYRRGLFWHRWWHLIDIDNSKRPRS